MVAVRVSPRPSENVRYSPELQEEQCREWCRENNHEVVGIVSDILVSGGSRHRFDSILDAIDRLRPDAFVVADLSRWTRDTPTRYYAMKGILEDSGIRLVSVAEPFVGSDTPFSDTITTAIVESNLQQRLISNRKTSEGVRKAWATGKRFGRCFGWTWDPRLREWSWDEPLIRSFYQDWIDGVSIQEMARRYGLYPQNIAPSIRAKRQADVVGAELWTRAQQAERQRSVRVDARWGNLWRGMLICPFCGGTLVHETRVWGRYRCGQGWDRRHDWQSLSARRTVLPVVAGVIQGLAPPDTAYIPRDTRVSVKHRSYDPSVELDRLSVAWAAGRLSTERYERAVAEVESRVVLPPPPPKVEVVRDIRAMLPFLDCHGRCAHEPGTCPRGRETAGLLNRLLHELFEPIRISPDREAMVSVREQYRVWMSD